MKKILYIAVFLFGFVGAANAQQRGVFSNFLLNDYYYNPAIAGSRNVHIANVSYRNQWVGFEGAPTLIMGNIHGSWKNQGKIGYGLALISESAGITQNTSVYLNYAHHFRLNETVKLGLGVQPGYMQYRVKLYDAQVADQGDDVLTGTVYSANAIDFNTGFHLYSDKFFIMGSVQHLLGESIQFTSYNSNLDFHFNAIAGYNFRINQKPEKKKEAAPADGETVAPKKKKKPIDIQPSLLFRYTRPVPVQWTGMLKATFDKKYWVGLIYRTDDAAGISLGMTLKERFNIGYGFDYTISGLSKYQSGTHEVMLSFIITKQKPSIAEEDDQLNKSIIEELQKKIDEREKDKKNNNN